MSTGILHVRGTQIFGTNDPTHPILLRGTALGGWMNMENFITGYPGAESQHRASMLRVLGEKYEYFFDRFLEYFFMEDDAKFLKKMGVNCLRLPMNYRHFEDDMRPREVRDGGKGFKVLERVVEICAKEGIYTILDLHALPGGQNGDWHSDNVTNHAAFWEHKDFQDRVIWLWCEIAKRFKDNPWIAGYNLINEPCDPLHWRLPAFYDRIEAEVRKVDPDHILWLDGNTFAMEWKHFDHVLPNTVYGLHDYSMMGFPKGTPYTGSEQQDHQLESQFLRKAEFMTKHATPIWNGEFGPVYADPALDVDHEVVNAARTKLLSKQLQIYDKYDIHWSIWLYKDIGLQGMVHLDPASAYMQLIAPFLAKKRQLQLDAWGRRPSKEVEDVIFPLVEFIDEHVPQSKDAYPTPWATERQVTRLVNQLWMSGCLSDEFAELFRDLSLEELDDVAKSFRFGQCVQRGGFNEVLERHASKRGGKGNEGDWKKFEHGEANGKLELD